MRIQIQQIASHRNGVCGEPFYAVLFMEAEVLMVATVFAKKGHVSVLGVGGLSHPDVGVTFGENSYRGDRYEATLRREICAWEEQRAGSPLSDEERRDLTNGVR